MESLLRGLLTLGGTDVSDNVVLKIGLIIIECDALMGKAVFPLLTESQATASLSVATCDPDLNQPNHCQMMDSRLPLGLLSEDGDTQKV